MLINAHINRIRLAGYRPRTVASREKVLRQFERTLAGRQIGEATRLDVEAFVGRDLAAESRRAYLGHLRAFFRWALDEEYVPTDPTSKLPSIRVPRGGPRPIDATQLVLAVKYADPRMRAWLLLMALGGLRCMEVAGLRPQDLLETESGVLLFLRETKGGASATVPAHPEVLGALSDVPIRNGAWWQCQAHSVSVMTSSYLRGRGVDATAHQLRHYSGTAWFRASGHDLLTTAALMRHASVKTTMLYAQLDPTRPAEVVNLVPRLRAV